MENKITIKNGKLQVPNHVTIPFIEGDGIGIEITPAMCKIVDAAVSVCYGEERKILWKEVFASLKAEEKYGTSLPTETLDAFKDYMVGIKGPMFTPTTGNKRSLNVALRQMLDLYACVRPVRYYPNIASPVKEPEKVNMTIFRENTEDIYAGIEWETGTEEAKKLYTFLANEMGVSKVRFPETSSFGIKPVSKEGTERLVRSAIEYAIANNCPNITIVHKGNIMRYTEGGFKKWAYELFEREYKTTYGKDLIIKDVIADAFLQNALLYAEDYSVIATLNLNGDYISDMLAAQVGGIGIAPGANINYISGHAIFEATHGTAPDIAGKNIANPCSMLLSAVMMLDYIGWCEAAKSIDEAIKTCFTNGQATADLARGMTNAQALSTSSFVDAIIANL